MKKSRKGKGRTMMEKRGVGEKKRVAASGKKMKRSAEYNRRRRK